MVFINAIDRPDQVQYVLFISAFDHKYALHLQLGEWQGECRIYFSRLICALVISNILEFRVRDFLELIESQVCLQRSFYIFCDVESLVILNQLLPQVYLLFLCVFQQSLLISAVVVADWVEWVGI